MVLRYFSRPNLVRSGSTRPSMARRREVGGATGIGAPVVSSEGQQAPAPLKRDTVRTIAFTAPCHVAGRLTMIQVALIWLVRVGSGEKLVDNAVASIIPKV